MGFWTFRRISWSKEKLVRHSGTPLGIFECSWFCVSSPVFVAIQRKQNEVGFNTVKYVIISKKWPCYNLVTYLGRYIYTSIHIIVYIYILCITPVDFFCELCCVHLESQNSPETPWGKIPRGPKRLGRCWTLQWATHLPHPSCEIQKAMKVLKIRNRGGRKNGRI